MVMMAEVRVLLDERRISILLLVKGIHGTYLPGGGLLLLGSLRWDLTDSDRCSPRVMDCSRNDDFPGLVGLVVPYLDEKLVEVWCLLLSNIL